MSAIRDLRWAAAVLETRGRFWCRLRDDRVSEARVEACVPREIGDELVRILGGVNLYDMWRLPADEQAQVISDVLPWFVDPRQIEAARAVLAIRLTQPARRIGWRISDAVRDWRRQAVNRARRARGPKNRPI